MLNILYLNVQKPLGIVLRKRCTKIENTKKRAFSLSLYQKMNYLYQGYKTPISRNM